MEKSLASSLINAVQQLDERLNDIDVQLRAVPDEAERKLLLRALGMAMAELDCGLIRPLVRQHPDLDPDR